MADDCVAPVTAIVWSTAGCALLPRMPGIHDTRPPTEDEEAGTLSAGRLVAGDALTLASGLWSGLDSGVEVCDLTF